MKQIQLRPNISEHDYQVKLKQLKKFLAKQLVTKIMIKFKGREKYIEGYGEKLFDKIENDLKGIAKINRSKDNQNFISGTAMPLKQQIN